MITRRVATTVGVCSVQRDEEERVGKEWRIKTKIYLGHLLLPWAGACWVVFRVKVKCERASERKNIVFETVPSYMFV